MVSPVPQAAAPAVERPISSNIKIASSNLFLINEAEIPVSKMTQMIFQDIGGQELTSFVRHDMVNGNNFNVQPFENLSKISQQNSINNLIKMQGTDDQLFNSSGYRLEDYIPQYGLGPDGAIVYIDTDVTSSTANNIIINVVGLSSNQMVEVDFISFDSKKNDTIYK